MDILLIKMVISILYLYILHTNTTSNVKKYSMQDIAILLQNIFATCLLQVFFYYFFIVLLCFVFDCSFFFLLLQNMSTTVYFFLQYIFVNMI
jgi:hypothetical protein